ncbi:uncharacterized protein LOC136085400 [Hydra vulgaris]|uniref:Uncharacterized protein LOC136085400 n=1 Tax=Hydra vulgaris TaxID=6087 RepID=A0ABM4CLV1_HYDVU
MWMRRIFMERSRKGLFNVLVKDLKLFDSVYFFQSFRMSSQSFEILLSWVAPFISKSSLRRVVATAEERLCIALRHLVTGDAQITIAISFRMSPSTIGRIIIKTCKVIWNVICKKGYLLAPSSQKEWLEISSEFYKRWNFPYYLGAIDGGSGRQNDGGIYNNSKVKSAIDNNLLNFPDPSCISGYSKFIIFPYTFLADEAFALKPHIMWPYPRRT